MSSDNQWRVTNPKSQVRWVGWQVLSSKARLNRPNRRLQKSGNSFWSNYFRSNEIYSRFREIIAKSGGNLTRSSEISPDVVRSPSDLANFPLKKPFWRIFPLWTTQPKPTAFRCLSDHSDPTLSPVSGGFELPPPDSVGSVADWAQTRPRLIHGHPYPQALPTM